MHGEQQGLYFMALLLQTGQQIWFKNIGYIMMMQLNPDSAQELPSIGCWIHPVLCSQDRVIAILYTDLCF